ncbi:MAG: hypothetical protein LC753_11085 [Acidobacteria bacterium]|nr:hypothetical protein [Acidobacteriota bacterium]MCA1650788.1 hypothetical protein [Acidobacteriota bacterium]
MIDNPCRGEPSFAHTDGVLAEPAVATPRIPPQKIARVHSPAAGITAFCRRPTHLALVYGRVLFASSALNRKVRTAWNRARSPRP